MGETLLTLTECVACEEWKYVVPCGFCPLSFQCNVQIQWILLMWWMFDSYAKAIVKPLRLCEYSRRISELYKKMLLLSITCERNLRKDNLKVFSNLKSRGLFEVLHVTKFFLTRINWTSSSLDCTEKKIHGGICLFLSLMCEKCNFFFRCLLPYFPDKNTHPK